MVDQPHGGVHRRTRSALSTLERIEQGCAQLIGVVGEAGAGKSRLIDAFLAVA
jgi:putative protein kinase ArgK-like GTPase of G3E family